MIFLGDIAVPSAIKPRIDFLPDSFKKQAVIANLEGAIIKPGQVSLKDKKLFSDKNVIDFLKECNVSAVSLANNHITDVKSAFTYTKNILKDNCIAYFGAGINLEEARKGYLFTDGNIDYIVISFGWEVISCIYATKQDMGVNPMEYANIIETIDRITNEFPARKIIVIMHWDYELEKYPMPAHRKLAKKLIDIGVEAVIGHHPHCVQGLEIYKGKVIAYSLGNWFIPGKTYMDKKLVFPEYANDIMALEISDNLVIHLFKYNLSEQMLKYVSSTNCKDCVLINTLSPFREMDDKQYENWFNKNRVKKKMLPVFSNYTDSIANRCKYKWVFIRQQIINNLFKLGLKRRSGIK